MTNGNGKKLQGLDDLLNELNDEVDEEKRAALKPADQRLDEVAREILRLERDLTVPGSPSSESVRIERLMNFIEGREF
jgi:hypothetical protein